MSDTCETCRYWNRVMNYDAGVCAVAGDTESAMLDADEAFGPWVDENAPDGRCPAEPGIIVRRVALTHEDFGCVRYESKDNPS